jgi:protein-L-isoaspartate(D-aspartate) O-methyltransferase
MNDADEGRWPVERARMVETQLRPRGIRSQAVLDAMRRVPRHRFIPEHEQAAAYGDFPVPIGQGQTISQPYIVAFMTEALELEASHRVLEIGTGSGYQTAVLAELSGEVFSIEVVAAHAERAAAILRTLGYANIHIRTGNGYAGWPEEAPFDRVIVTAAPDEVPAALIEQVKMDGLIAVPVGVGEQLLQIMRRTDTGLHTLQTLPVRFVPMIRTPP